MSFRGSRRAQSETVGVVLLLGLVITGAGLVVVLGSTAIGDSQDRANLGGAEQTMSQFDSQASLVAHGSVESREVDLPTDRSGSGGTEVDPTAGTLTVEISGDTNFTRTVTLGTVRYRQGETTVAYQGGGVWRHRDNGSVMVSPPEFHYRTGGSGQPTLTLPLVTVSGRAGGNTARLDQAGPTESIIPNGTVRNPVRDSEVNVTISSRYYKAWGRFFEERTSGDVTYDHAADNVTIQLVAPAASNTVNNAVTSDSGTLTVDSSAFVDSYDSDEGPYDAGDNFRGAVSSTGTYDMSSNAEIQGTVDVNGTASFQSSNIIVHRGVFINGTGGTTDVQNAERFGRDFHVGGDLTVSDGSDLFDRNVFVGGNVPTFEAGVARELHVGGDATLSSSADLNDDVVVGGDVTVKTDEVAGTIYAGGDVTVKAGATTGDIVAAGDVKLTDSNSQVNGDVEAGDDIHMSGGGQIDGNATVTDDVFLNDSGAEITGDVEAGGTVSGSGSVGGSTTTGVSPPPSVDPRSPTAPTPATTPEFEPVNDEINDKEAELSASNDNNATSNISSNTLSGCNSGCTLHSGEYFLDSMSVGNSDSLTFDTTGGNIEIYVENDISWEGSVSIVGDGQVEIYTSGSYTIKDNLNNPGDESDQLWLYMKPGQAANLQTNNANLTGVIYGPANASDSLDVNIDSNAELYGAVVGSVDTSSNSEIHYDLALRDSEVFTSNSTVPKVTYLHISTTEVEVE